MKIPHFGLVRQYEFLKDELLDATHRSLKDGQLVSGHYTRSVEEYLKYKTKSQFAITVHSGTQALEIIAKHKLKNYKANFNLTPTIKVPNLTYPATLNAFLSTGWNVELVDTDNYGIIDLSDETRKVPIDFICVVGLYGKQVNLSKTDSFRTIVDGAQHWTVADENIGSGMAISFDPTKNLPSSGNGGAIVTNDIDLYHFATYYKNNGKEIEFGTYGTNTKMSEQDCAQLLVRAKYLDKWQIRRSKIAEYYRNNLKDLPLTILNDGSTPHANQKFVVVDYENRNKLHEYLLYNGVESKIHYDKPLSELGMSLNLKKPDMMSKSVILSRSVLSLPIYPELTDAEVELITKIVSLFYK